GRGAFSDRAAGITDDGGRYRSARPGCADRPAGRARGASRAACLLGRGHGHHHRLRHRRDRAAHRPELGAVLGRRGDRGRRRHHGRGHPHHGRLVLNPERAGFPVSLTFLAYVAGVATQVHRRVQGSRGRGAGKCRGRRLRCGPMDAPAAEVTLSPDDVRRMTLRAQGFLGATSWPRSRASRGSRVGVSAMLHRVGAVQLDTISVLARSHELVAYARLGPVSRQAIEQAYWHASRPAAFEYWAHAACVLPLAQWPYFAFRRRAFRARGVRWHQVTPEACEKVLARLRAEGPLTATQLGGAKAGGPWWDWSDVKIAVEWLLDTGEVICVRRTGWRRVYDLPERVLPDELLGAEPSDAECLAHLAGVTARALGVVVQADLTEY